MNKGKQNPLSGITKRNIYVAVFIGLAISAYLVIRNFDTKAFSNISWSGRLLWFALLIVGIMLVRHLAFMYRIWLVTGKTFSFRQSFEVILMWEFAAVATPSTIGGSAVAMYLLNKEGVNLGKSTASVFLITLLDNLFFALSAIIMILILGSDRVFDVNRACSGFQDLPILRHIGGIQYLFGLGIGMSLLLTFLLGWAILVNARSIKNLLIGIFSIRFLHKWRDKAEETGDELIVAASELQSKSIGFWFGAFGSTAIDWTLKYLVVNTLIMAFVPVDSTGQLIIISRVLALWIVMLLPLTPGASGLAEIAFVALLCDYLPSGLGGSIAFMWRFFTYYPYLIFGALYMPIWLRRVYSSDERPGFNAS